MEKTKYKVFVKHLLKTICFKNCEVLGWNFNQNFFMISYKEHIIQINFIEYGEKEMLKELYFKVEEKEFVRLKEEKNRNEN